MKTIFDLLDAIKMRPTLYVGEDELHRDRQLHNLEMLLHGYSCATEVHDIAEPGRHLLRSFSDYVQRKHGWSVSAGPVAAIIANTISGEEAWQTFWRLVEEFRMNPDG